MYYYIKIRVSARSNNRLFIPQNLPRLSIAACTVTYRVFHHDLLITKLHHINYKIILMAYMVKKIGFVASRKSNYLNKW